MEITKEQLELLKKFQMRIARDYQMIVELYSTYSPKTIINKAYELAHYNEIDDLVYDLDPETDFQPYDYDDINLWLDLEGNLLEIIYNGWLNYGHPERYNFFCWEDLVSIIEDTLNYKAKGDTF